MGSALVRSERRWARSRPEDCFEPLYAQLTTAASDHGSIAVRWPGRLNCSLLRLRASLLGVSRYRNLVGRISLISIISAGIRVGWRRVM